MVHVGGVLTADQLVGRLDPQIQDNALRSAQANLASLEVVLTEARLTFSRQQALLKDGWATRANFDDAQQKLLTVEAQVELRSGAGPDRARAAGLHHAVRRPARRCHRGRRRAGRGGSRRADGRAARHARTRRGSLTSEPRSKPTSAACSGVRSTPRSSAFRATTWSFTRLTLSAAMNLPSLK